MIALRSAVMRRGPRRTKIILLLAGHLDAPRPHIAVMVPVVQVTVLVLIAVLKQQMLPCFSPIPLLLLLLQKKKLLSEQATPCL